ncbi:MAG: hypothetical protein EA427_17530 [Spirochaetaceae bacterium]|nr:MAG: hypothetical protein EA427_17530 [Spirochaetaceae bacterium]
MKEWQPETIRDLLLEAGRIALHHYQSPRTERKPDRSLVTVADHAIEAFLAERLPAGNDSTLLGEETVGIADEATIRSVRSGITWIVDPIDGTSSYANQLPTWGISLGRMEAGRFTDGALFLPRTGDLFLTSGKDVLYAQESRDPDSWRFDELSVLQVEERPYSPIGMVSLPHEVAKGGRFEGVNPLQANGSAVYSLANLVLGSYIAYIARIKLWDVAGAVPILKRLGFHIQYEDGRELGETVSERDWFLDPEEPRLWKSTGPWYIAGSQDTVDYLREHYHPDPRWKRTVTRA